MVRLFSRFMVYKKLFSNMADMLEMQKPILPHAIKSFPLECFLLINASGYYKIKIDECYVGKPQYHNPRMEFSGTYYR